MPERNRRRCAPTRPSERICDFSHSRVRCIAFPDHLVRVGLPHHADAGVTSQQLGSRREIQTLAAETEGLCSSRARDRAASETLMSDSSILINPPSRARGDIDARSTRHERAPLISNAEAHGGAEEMLELAPGAGLREDPDVVVLDSVRSPPDERPGAWTAVPPAGGDLRISAHNPTGAVDGIMIFPADGTPQVQIALAESGARVIVQVLLNRPVGALRRTNAQHAPPWQRDCRGKISHFAGHRRGRKNTHVR